MVKEKAKSIWNSKTFWFAIAQFVCGAGLAVIGEYNTTGILTVTAVLTIVLRYYTKNPVKF